MKHVWIAVLMLLGPLRLAAQNPDLALTQAERDSLLASYDQIFPIWGRKAIERGFDLPAPFGLNVGVFAASQGVVISNLGLGFNEPAAPATFIQFREAKAQLTNWNVRADLWVFPFLNVYGIAGTGPGQTTVHVVEPVEFSTTADFQGENFGIGLTGAFGFRRNFVVLDWNHQWASSSLLSAPVPVNVFSTRIGRGFRVGARSQRMRGTFWVGTMLQTMKNETVGSINLADVVPPGLDSLFASYDTTSWYQGLTPPQQALVDNFVQRLSGALDTTVVNYTLNKKVADPWNLLVGGTFDYRRNWGLRAEVGLIGRTSAFLMLNYRFTF